MVDEIRMRELYEQISALAGESIMEELNRQLKQTVSDRAADGGIHAGADQRSALQAGRPRPRNQPSDVPALSGRPAGGPAVSESEAARFIIFRKRRMQGCNVLRPLHPYILDSDSGNRQNQRSPRFSDTTPRFFFAIISVRRETAISSALF